MFNNMQVEEKWNMKRGMSKDMHKYKSVHGYFSWRMGLHTDVFGCGASQPPSLKEKELKLEEKLVLVRS